jgi:tetratricopeptide (TPR) repeat protein
LVGATVTERRGITNKPEALELYMQARYEMNKMSEESLRKAIQLFKDAIAIDPEYALANSGIADCYIAMEEVNHFKYYKSDDIENYSNAKSYSQKALDIEPDLGEALAVVARMKHVLDKDYPEAERLFNNAIELSPDHPTSYDWYGGLLAWRLNDNSKARAMHKKALKLDPLSPSINASAGIFYLQRLKDDDSAYYFLNKAFQLEPNYVNGNHRFIFTELLENRHEWERAEKSWIKAYDLDPKNYTTLWGMSHYYLMRGNLDKSKTYLDQMKELGMGWTEDYALEGWYYFYGKNNIDASIPYFIKSVAYTSNPKKFQNWFVWFDLIYALGSTGRCDEINKLSLEKVWSEFEHQERDQIAEMIISASNEFYCGNKTITLDSLTKTQQIFSEKSVYFENYYYTKTILLMEYGDTKGALNLLENRYDFGQSSYYMFIRHPALLPLKDNQRFQKILKKASMD